MSSGQRFEIVSAALPGGNAEARAPVSRGVRAERRSGHGVVQAFLARAGNGQIELSNALDVSTLAVSVWRAR
ncbi:hypothetical protein [Nocardia sp. NPDC047038]|uniref:hypothetical protein n=1 Tax=Nocardia sp. NPDC047038 TaxID=3154338 RepID=UPI0033F47602